MVAQTRRISPGSGLNVDTAMPFARPVRPAWSEPSPQARNPTSSLASRRRESLLRGGLLGVLLRAARAGPGDLAVDHRRGGERAVVRWPLHVEHGVGDRAAEASELLLEFRLVVDVRRQRVFDPGLERLHDRRLD